MGETGLLKARAQQSKAGPRITVSGMLGGWAQRTGPFSLPGTLWDKQDPCVKKKKKKKSLGPRIVLEGRSFGWC